MPFKKKTKTFQFEIYLFIFLAKNLIIFRTGLTCWKKMSSTSTGTFLPVSRHTNKEYFTPGSSILTDVDFSADGEVSCWEDYVMLVLTSCCKLRVG